MIYVGIQWNWIKQRLNHLLNVKDDGDGILALLPSSSSLSQSPRKLVRVRGVRRGVACCLIA